MWDVTEKEFKIISNWGHEIDPFKAVSDYSERKNELRWLNPENREAYIKYIQARLEYIQNKDFDNYYKSAKKPIDLLRWKYLIKRKAWFIMPLGWENIALHGNIVADVGCGDGDIVQRLIDFVDNYWSNHQIKNRKLHIVGIDLNESRIENAKKHVQSKNPNISFEFFVLDVVENGLKYIDKYFDYSITTGVLEILDDKPCEKFVGDVCRITSKGIYIEDLFEKFPGGYPRDNLGDILERHEFKISKRHVILSEPFDVDKLQDPLKLWPMMLDQNIWAERT